MLTVPAMIDGDFEVHITLHDDFGVLSTLRDFCASRGWKCVHIHLSRGNHASQPMVTFRSKGTRLEVLAKANQEAGHLLKAGFVPCRVKLESSPFATGVPQTDSDPHVPGGYFEHHVKLLLAMSSPFDVLVELVERFCAHLSQNAFKCRDDGREERFVTMRNFNVGQQSATARLNEMLASLRNAGFVWISVESEYSVFDSHIGLDAGWLEPSNDPE